VRLPSPDRDLDAAAPDPDARRTALLGTAGVVGQAVLVVGWLIAGLVQDGYDPARQDIGELGAVGATAPWLHGAALVVGGLLTVALAVGVWRTLAPGPRSLLGVGLLGLYGLGTALEGVLPVDCWSIDLACRAQVVVEGSSWHHEAHGVADAVAVIALIVAPYALARPFGDDDGWRRWSTPSVVLGMSLIVLLIVYGAAPDVDGLTQRLTSLVAAAYLVTLGLQVRRLADRARPPRPPKVPREGRRTLWPRRELRGRISR
jgi:hypothetical membrane protein